MFYSFFDLWCRIVTGGHSGGGTVGGATGGSNAVPEFDGPGAIAAAALIISVAAVLYDKAKK